MSVHVKKISDDRVNQIVGRLNGFMVHEREFGTELHNGRAVPCSWIVGTDYNWDRACEWAMGLAETEGYVVVPWPEVHLTDGTVIAWSPDISRWEVAVTDERSAAVSR
jgi:hypothetical protein